jgi:hypothetical protein
MFVSTRAGLVCPCLELPPHVLHRNRKMQLVTPPPKLSCSQIVYLMLILDVAMPQYVAGSQCNTHRNGTTEVPLRKAGGSGGRHAQAAGEACCILGRSPGAVGNDRPRRLPLQRERRKSSNG